MSEALTMSLPAGRTAAALDVEAMYRECRDDIYAYVATLLRDPAAAEDATSAAFERAFRRRATYRPRRGSPRAWLFGIARNAALDELRRRRRTAALAAEPEDAEALSAPDTVDEAARRATVRAGLAQLDARDRELVALKFFAGLTNAELARVLGISEANAGTRLHRAVTRLRKACHATP